MLEGLVFFRPEIEFVVYTGCAEEQLKIRESYFLLFFRVLFVFLGTFFK